MYNNNVGWLSRSLENLVTRIHEWLWTGLLWRNTKEVVAIDRLIPPLKEHVIELELTRVERQIYDEKIRSIEVDVSQLRQICAHPQISYKFKQLLTRSD